MFPILMLIHPTTIRSGLRRDLKSVTVNRFSLKCSKSYLIINERKAFNTRIDGIILHQENENIFIQKLQLLIF